MRRTSGQLLVLALVLMGGCSDDADPPAVADTTLTVPTRPVEHFVTLVREVEPRIRAAAQGFAPCVGEAFRTSPEACTPETHVFAQELLSAAAVLRGGLEVSGPPPQEIDALVRRTLDAEGRFSLSIASCASVLAPECAAGHAEMSLGLAELLIALDEWAQYS